MMGRALWEVDCFIGLAVAAPFVSIAQLFASLPNRFTSDCRHGTPESGLLPPLALPFALLRAVYRH